jgi:hypothetical protein
MLVTVLMFVSTRADDPNASGNGEAGAEHAPELLAALGLRGLTIGGNVTLFREGLPAYTTGCQSSWIRAGTRFVIVQGWTSCCASETDLKRRRTTTPLPDAASMSWWTM